MNKNLFDITKKNFFVSCWNDLVSQIICFLGSISTTH